MWLCYISIHFRYNILPLSLFSLQSINRFIILAITPASMCLKRLFSIKQIFGEKWIPNRTRTNPLFTSIDPIIVSKSSISISAILTSL